MLDTLKSFVNAHRNGGVHSELELRLGKYIQGNFYPGVCKPFFDALDYDLSRHFTSDGRWCELIDYYYLASDGRQARTRVEFDINSMEISRTHIIKQTEGTLTAEEASGDVQFACRFAFAREEPFTNPPRSCLPTLVRVKQYRHFDDVRDGEVVWRYVLSRTWTSNSRMGVDRAQKTTSPRYEVELELGSETKYMAARTDEEIATSFMYKVESILGPTELVQRDVSHIRVQGTTCKKSDGDAHKGKRHTGKRKSPE